MADGHRPEHAATRCSIEPYVDVDEWREVPVRHRYVHGGFAGTDTRFSMYFPPADRYEGRFFQHITPVPDSEHLAQEATGEQDRIGFSISSGGYFLETNGGGASGRPGSSVDPTIAAYRANAAAARVLAGRRRPHVRRAPALRLCLRGERRRLPHHRQRREHRPASGTASSPTSSGRRWRYRTCSRSGCTPNGFCATGSTRSSTPSNRVGAATCSRGSLRRSGMPSPR